MIKGKKDFLARCFYYSGICHLAKFWNTSGIVVINYHRIKTAQKDHVTLFDDGVFGPDQHEFEKQMKWLKRNTHILSENDLINVINNKLHPKKRAVAITFDDGYIDNYTLAYPILKYYQIPAIFFIPSQAIEERCLGWWDFFAYFLKTTRKEEITLHRERLHPKDDLTEALSFVLHLVYQNKMKASEVSARLSDICEVAPPDKEVQSKQLMSWDQLKEVAANGIDIGAHTHSHRILSSLTLKQQQDEITGSKTIIEQKLGQSIRSMSYPVGSLNHFTSDTKKIAMGAGFEIAFSFNTGINSYGNIDSMDIKRIGASYNLYRFVCEIEFNRIFVNSFAHGSNL